MQQQQQTPKNTGLIGSHYKQVFLFCTTQSINCVYRKHSGSYAQGQHKSRAELSPAPLRCASICTEVVSLVPILLGTWLEITINV